ncbi:IS5 family transposase [Candidatus Albibeggiatoa sp. nov. NOAA]|uniref:IS5 family transposase n=1 Tax=Candidatus Albibeggiatoa sp. nov. NOAA TaxID=3162724 RepID=UPI0032FA7F4F|nr:IS5 family transposase [Thiotrichaceae bacterium]
MEANRRYVARQKDVGVTAKDSRVFVEAVLWIARTGSPWRDLPEEYGYWHRVYVRYNRWSHKGLWDKMFTELSKEADFEYIMIDGSIVRVHQHGAAEKVQQGEQAQGKSVGGLSTKIQAAVDALGNPIKFILTRGQDVEVKQAKALIEDFDMDYLLADKDYDSGNIIQFVEDNGGVAVIPLKKQN